MENFEIGSVHIIWVNPFCDDAEAEVVSYDRLGFPIMRLLEDGTTLEPHEYVLPAPDQVLAIQRMEELFEAVHGEKL